MGDSDQSPEAPSRSDGQCLPGLISASEVYSCSAAQWLPIKRIEALMHPGMFQVYYDNAVGEQFRKNLGMLSKHLHSDANLFPASQQELELLQDFFQVKEPESLGKGWDVKSTLDAYDDLVVKAAWTVRPDNPLLQRYAENRNRQNQEYARKGVVSPISTALDDVQCKCRALDYLQDNEYFLLHGTQSQNIASLVKEGFRRMDGAPQKTFGDGTYLSDVPEKIDQYANVEPNFERELRELLVGGDVQLQALVESQKPICFAFVVRAFLGKHVQVQRQEIPSVEEMRKLDKVGKRETIWHWREPNTGERISIPDTPSEPLKERKPPFECDSVKVMCGKSNPEYSSEWSNGQNGLPHRFNEYIVPFSDPPKVVPQYLIAYARSTRGTT